MNNKALNLLLLIVGLILTLTIAQALSAGGVTGGDAALRFLGALLGAVAAGVVFYLTRQSEAWALDLRIIINGAAGAMLYAVCLWLFSGAMFAIPEVGDLGLRPAIVFPILFGCLFGPLAGFIAGGFGGVFGNLLAGLPVAPEWVMAGAAAGLVAGLRQVFPDRPRTLDAVTYIVGALGILATASYLASPGLANPFAGAPVSPWLGLSVLAGVILVIGLRYGLPQEEWTKFVLWGALGNLAGMALAAISDLWVDAAQLGAAGASVGRFIPAAGPNLIALVILLPILLVSLEQLKEGQAA